jgi:isocitrate dehydrogenase
MSKSSTKAPEGGRIRIENGVLKVPSDPVLPFIEGDRA